MENKYFEILNNINLQYDSEYKLVSDNLIRFGFSSIDDDLFEDEINEIEKAYKDKEITYLEYSKLIFEIEECKTALYNIDLPKKNLIKGR